MPNFILGGRGQGNTLIVMATYTKHPQLHGSLFEKSTAAGVLGEWLPASASC